MDTEEREGLPFKELRLFYARNFSLGFLGSDINKKFALISLICYLTKSLQKKQPDVTYYQVLMKLTKDNSLPERYIKGLAIICEDFAYGCKEFPTFEIKPNEIVPTIKNLLLSSLPF